MLSRRWSRWLRRRYADPTFAYHGAAHVGLLWLRHLAHGDAADDVGAALGIMFHDAVYQPGGASSKSSGNLKHHQLVEGVFAPRVGHGNPRPVHLAKHSQLVGPGDAGKAR